MLCMDSIPRQSYHPLFVEMATCSSLFNSHARSTVCHPLIQKKENSTFSERFSCPTRSISRRGFQLRTCCFLQVATLPPIELSLSDSNLLHTLFDNSEVSGNAEINITETSEAAAFLVQQLTLADIDPGTAKIAIGILGPFLSAFGFLFILRIVMSWFPKLPVGKFPYVIAYAPTEPLLVVTRKVIPPLGGVDVTPVVWFGILSFLNEILVGPQGLLVLLSQQVN